MPRSYIHTQTLFLKPKHVHSALDVWWNDAWINQTSLNQCWRGVFLSSLQLMSGPIHTYITTTQRAKRTSSWRGENLPMPSITREYRNKVINKDWATSFLIKPSSKNCQTSQHHVPLHLHNMAPTSKRQSRNCRFTHYTKNRIRVEWPPRSTNSRVTVCCIAANSEPQFLIQLQHSMWGAVVLNEVVQY